jgi:hypothetical protein
MLPYCHSFKHTYTLPSIQDLYPNGEYAFIKAIPYSLLDSEFFKWLSLHNIQVSELVVAWKPPEPAGFINHKHSSIHSDGPGVTKINFILGGVDSQMIWFEKPRIVYRDRTIIDTPIYKAWDRQPLTPVYREPLRAALVNSERFHYIENTKDDRFSIQCSLWDLHSGQRCTFDTAYTRLFG